MSLTYQIDDLTIHRIVEYQDGMVPATTMLPDLTDAMLAPHRDWLVGLGAMTPDGRIVLCFQSYLVRTPSLTVLIDTCIGNDKIRSTRPHWHRKRDGRFMRALAEAGVTPADIDMVLCTHLHVDHVGWNTRLDNGRWVPTFPNARYLFAQKELDFWTRQHAKEPIEHFADSVLPIVLSGQAERVANNFECSEEVRLLPTPGHTIDHVAIALGRARDAAVITGDLIHSPLQMRMPELRMLRDYDAQQSAHTRRTFLERYCDRDTLCCTSHFPNPSVGRIRTRRNASGYELVPV